MDIAKTKVNNALQYIFTAVRILIGWHFLYEGLSKLISPNWSAAGYMLESSWLFSGFFHNLAMNEAALRVVDFMNVWGLIFIGFGLLVGGLTRIASGAGALLLLFYYVANPPFIGFMGETTGEGHYLIVNKIMIEFAVLLLLALLPSKTTLGMDRIIKRFFKKPDKPEATLKNEPDLAAVNQRREMLKDLITLPVLGGFVWAALKKKKWESFEERNLISQPSRVDAVFGASPKSVTFSGLDNLEGQIPKGRIGNYEISRILAGGNLISGYAHSRDLIYVSHLVQSYFSDEKVIETFKLCEAVGINAMIVRVDVNTLRIMEKFRKRGGKMHWIAQCKIKDDELAPDIDAAVDNGAIACYIHGGICDETVRADKTEVLVRAVEYIKSKGVLAGLAGHDIQVIMECEKYNANPDFFMKTLNSGNYWTAGPRLITDPEWQPNPKEIVEPEFGADVKDNIWSTTPEQTIEFMKEVQKPWISYKVLGAGAIHPKDGFRYAFENGADFACVGMFDWQVVENANIAINLLKENIQRVRPWQA
ncbi:MAG: DoxX family protein [Bacteroidales bacterium]|nr:DoxX family protein [Bacteroidales bacterium]